MKFLVLLLALISTSFSAFSKELVDKVIAVVNSEAVLQSELNSLVSRSKKQGGVDDSLLLEDSLEKLKSDRQAQLNYLIREKLVESEIKRQNLSLTDDRIDSEMSSLAKRNGMTRQDLESYLKNQGYSIADYRKNLKSRLERQSFFESEIVSKLRITDEDAYSEFRARNPNYRPNVNEFKISQIYFNPQKGGGAEALKRAQEVSKRISEGESFETAASKFNESPDASPDGYLGSFKSGEFIPEIERAIAPLDAGSVSAVIQSKVGFHIVKVLDKKLTQDPQFVRIKEQIKASLVEKNFKRQLKNWFESKKQDAYVKIN